MQSTIPRGRRRYQAPTADGQALVEPPFRQVGRLVRENATLVAESGIELAGRPLAQIAHAARGEFLAAALRYTAAYRDVPEAAARSIAEQPERCGPVFVSGHQPRLFHPGVWFKNFALSRLAAEHHGLGVNLIIDSDAAHATALRVPTGEVSDPAVRSISFDAASGELPFEERPIVDRDLFDSFGRRATEAIRSLVPQPLVEKWWPEVVRQANGDSLLGQVIARARHQLEASWGLQTLEVPQSEVCRTESFAWFVAEWLRRPERNRRIYNEALTEYRRANRIRSRSHPVPNLAVQDEWLETPFWVWTSADPRRRPLVARPTGHGGVILGDLAGWEQAIAPSAQFSDAPSAEAIHALAGAGVKIRTRAITTTMFARLLLGDLFLHGIGGAKYDELTDMLIQGLFDAAPPAFMVLSATLRLPTSPQSEEVISTSEIQRRLRELVYHPEHHVDRELARREGCLDELDSAVRSKRTWIAAPGENGQGKTRHEGITAANEAMQRWVRPERKMLLARRQSAATAEAREAILASREYAFCLFPEERLRGILLELSGARA